MDIGEKSTAKPAGEPSAFGIFEIRSVSFDGSFAAIR
jgi:hypothetical protein